jgi:hypothetical protein
MVLMFPSGYGASNRLRNELDHDLYMARLGVHPEVIRRFKALCVACCEAGHPLGAGGGKRSSAVQLAGFLDVHVRVASKAQSDGCYYDGSWWAQKPLTIHKAPPHLSYHEGSPTDVDPAYAIDAVGDQIYMQSIAHFYGLRVFGKIDYPHVQPLEFPPSRATFNQNPAAYVPITQFALPGTAPTPQEAEMKIVSPPIRVLDTRTTNAPLGAGEIRDAAVMFGGTEAAINITVVPITPSGFLKVWSKDVAEPNTSNVNWQNGEVVGNLAMTGTQGGWVKLKATGACHVIIDLQGAA